jgi:transcriptional/translational regulatory protein YebC/TACO1
MEAAIESGAEDVLIDDDGSIEVLTDPTEYEDVRAAMVKAGLEPEEEQLTMRASTSTSLDGDDAVAMVRMLEMLEDLDDVQEVYSNAELSADALAGA